MDKYPKTLHIDGSQLAFGDTPKESVSFRELMDKHLVIEEKMDGSNTGISFDSNGQMYLQSRGHYLTGGPRERQYDLFKQWAGTMQGLLWPVLSDKYVAYGEWLYAKHTIFYDALTHFWMEFDIMDRKHGVFLDTPSRRDLLAGLPIVQVKVLQSGIPFSLKSLINLIGPSNFISPNQVENLLAFNYAEDTLLKETDTTGLMEGLYIKWEADGIVKGRYKLVRPGFLQTMIDSGEHWQDRPLFPNMLREDVDIWKV